MSETHVADLASRLASLLSETEAVHAQAHATNDGRLLLQAVGTETATVAALIKRLGIDSTELVSSIREARVLATACAAVLPRYPGVLRELAAELGSQEHGSQLADAFRALVAPSVRLSLSPSSQHEEATP